MDDRLQAYEDLVTAHATRLNLVAVADLDRFRQRHVDDSLRLVPLVGTAPDGPGVDVGSGAGLPGVPLAVAIPERQWVLLEPRRRRAAFLEEVVRELGLGNAEVVQATAQEFARRGPVHAVAVARALAEPAAAFDLLEPLVAPGGVAILLVGERAEIPRRAEFASEGVAIVRLDREA